jgi:hypothetical protein
MGDRGPVGGGDQVVDELREELVLVSKVAGVVAE